MRDIDRLLRVLYGIVPLSVGVIEWMILFCILSFGYKGDNESIAVKFILITGMLVVVGIRFAYAAILDAIYSWKVSKNAVYSLLGLFLMFSAPAIMYIILPSE
jgi:hypothetical protein